MRPEVIISVGQFGLPNSGGGTDISLRVLASLPWVPLSLSYLGPGILFTCGPLWGGSVVLPNTTRDLQVFSGSLSSLQTHHPWAILLHPAGASYTECSCSFYPSPKFQAFSSKPAPYFSSVLPSFKSLFWQSRLERNIIDHFWQSTVKRSHCFQGTERKQQGHFAHPIVFS